MLILSFKVPNHIRIYRTFSLTPKGCLCTIRKNAADVLRTRNKMYDNADKSPNGHGDGHDEGRR